MAFIPKTRAWIALTGLFLATAIGALGGFLLGRTHIEGKAEVALVGNATLVQEMFERAMAEAYSTLAALKAANLHACSDAELVRFRQLIYQSVDIRDAGRMRDGRLECSADFGKGTLPETQFQPSNTLRDGTEVYFDLPPYRTASGFSTLLRNGDFFVAEDPNTINRWRIVNKSSEIYMRSDPGNAWRRISGRPPKITTAIADHNGQGRVGDTLYGTHCSIDKSSCTVAYGSLSETLHTGRLNLIFYSAFGALLGAFVVLVYLLINANSRSMANQLRRAIRQDKLQMAYQPIVDLRSGRVVGAEALVRWTDEEGYAVSPEIFVRLAEERGFIGELTERIVHNALHDFHKLQGANPDFRLNINITASDLTDEIFLPMLEAALATAGVAPQSLAIEVTEGSTANQQAVMKAIRLLRDRGHSVEIDDFGTGYSSLAYLKDLAVDAIKIDRTFAQAIGTGAVIDGLLPHILAMAETLHMKAIIEGIETLEQLEYFADLKMPLAVQGFLLGRPVPVDEFHNMRTTVEDEIKAAS